MKIGRGLTFVVAILASISPAIGQTASAAIDLNAWADQVITTDSQGWSIYSYNRGSARNAYVAGQTADGMTVVHADYSYGSTNDSVDVFVSGDSIYCIQYSGEACRSLYTSPSNTGAYLAAGLLAVLAVGAISSGSGDTGNATANSTDDDYYRYRNQTQQSEPEDRSDQDDGSGCYWGYESTGTCH